MLPGLGFGEFIVLAIVALVVVGPRDLPRLAKTVGGYVRQARQMANEFRKSFDEMGRELELEELRKEVDALKRGAPFDDIKRELKAIDDDAKAVDREVRSGAAAAPPAVSGPAPAASPASLAPPPQPEDTGDAAGGGAEERAPGEPEQAKVAKGSG